MKFMKNNYLKFDDIDSGIGIVKNISTLNILSTIPSKYFSDDYILEKKLEDDSLIEGISQELYGSTDYWDIILVLNGMTSMDLLPANYDTVLERTQEELEDWVNRGSLVYLGLTEDDILTKESEILQNKTDENEKYRYLKYISSDDMSSLIAELKDLKGEAAIDTELIIS